MKYPFAGATLSLLLLLAPTVTADDASFEFGVLGQRERVREFSVRAERFQQIHEYGRPLAAK